MDISNCNNIEDVQTSKNSIPGWSVEYIEKIALQPAHSDRIELLMRVGYPIKGSLPSLLVREIASDNSVVEKNILQTVYKDRERTLE